jgi:exosortase
MPDQAQRQFAPPHGDIPPVAFLLPLAVALLVFAWPTLGGLAGVYRTDGNFSHGFLVPLVSGFAAWRLRHGLVCASRRDRFPGLLPLGLGIGGVLFARWYELALMPRGVIAMCLAGLGMVLVVTGLAWLAVGHRGVWQLRFPLGFLLLAVPVPSFLLHRVTIPLQQVSAAISAAALHAIRVAVERQGSVLRFPAGQLGVDEACSGIRSLAVLAAVALTMIHFNRLRRGAALVLLLLVVPLAVLTNAVRVFLSGVFYSQGWTQLSRGGPHELLGLLTILFI